MNATARLRAVGEFLWMLPRNVFILVLRVYRAVISPLYGQVCRYYPSCSSYGLEAMQQHGVVKAIGLTAWRVLRCNPWSRGGVDDIPERRLGRLATTRWGFVLGFRPAPADQNPHSHHPHHPHERTSSAHA